MSEQSIHISDWVVDVLRELDPKLLPTSDGYSEASILAASYVAGADEATIASALGFDREFVDIVGNRLRTAKIWQGAAVNARAKARWNEEPISMLIDVNVARGSMIIASYDGDEPMYSLSPEGRRNVERILASPPNRA
jgi:hypothetical protein